MPRYLNDKELEEALYDDNFGLDVDFVDPDLVSSDSENEDDQPVIAKSPADELDNAEDENLQSDENESSSEGEAISDDEHDDNNDERKNDDNDYTVDIPAPLSRRRNRPKASIVPGIRNMVAPSNVVWKSKPMRTGRHTAANIMREPPDLKPGVNPKSPLEAFMLFFDNITIDIILESTNQKLHNLKLSSRSIFVQKSRNFSKEEILGIIGFLITSGAYKQNKDTVDELFSAENLPIYRATIAKHRFLLLLKCLRFDDFDTCNERKKTDNFAAARNLWNNVVNKFPNFLNPSESLVIDEELITFHGRCKFRVFIPTKPGKYGIEVNVLCDSENYYCFAAEPYAGKVENQEKNYNSGPEVVKRLIVQSKLENSRRNITMDRKFTSLSVAEDLLQKNLTIVGTIMSNKRDVPIEMRPNALRKSIPGTIKFAFHENITLVSYIPKPKKVVTVLSSQHPNDMAVRDDKPEIILYYNSTKAGVVTLDKCVRSYSCRRGTRRWPMAIFFNLIDIAVCNAYVLFSKANEIWSKNNPKRHSGRKIFLKELGKSLCVKNMEKRSQSRGLQNLYIRALAVFGFNCNEIAAVTRGTLFTKPKGRATRGAVANLPRKGRCFLCPRSADRKYMKSCSHCEKYICPKHTVSEEKVITRKCSNC